MTVNAATSLAKVGVGIDNNAESPTVEAGRAGAICWLGDGTINYNGTLAAYTFSPFSVGDVLGVDTNLTSGTIRFRVNGGSFSSNFSISAITGGAMYALAQLANLNDQITANFSGTFAFSPPSTAWG